MAELRKWDQVRTELRSDPETSKEYEELRPQFEMISQIIKERCGQKISRENLV